MRTQVAFFLAFGFCFCSYVLLVGYIVSQGWMRKTTLLDLSSVSRDSQRIPSTLATKTQGVPQEAPCQATTNLVFIKIHRTGSTTLATQLYRFGYNRNLSFLFSSKQKLGHFRQTPVTSHSQPEMYPPIGVTYGDYGNYKFNISAGHLIYGNRNAFDSLMAGQPRYITLLRDPVRQYVSYFYFFGMTNRYMKGVKFPSKDQFVGLATFLKQPLKYSDLQVKSEAFIPNRNPQFYQLGLPLKQMGNPDYVQASISRIEEDFDLVLIVEYLDESLVLMKKRFCWEMGDILYFKMNVKYQSPLKVPADLRRQIRVWNSDDVSLYDHFNRTLWRKIQEYGPTFQADLDAFRERLKDMKNECVAGEANKRALPQYELKANASRQCREVNMDIFARFAQITGRQRIPQQKRRKRNAK